MKRTIISTIEPKATIGGMDRLLCEERIGDRTDVTVRYQRRNGRTGDVITRYEGITAEQIWQDPVDIHPDFRRWMAILIEDIGLDKVFDSYFVVECPGDYDPVIPTGMRAIPLYRWSGTKYAVVPEHELWRLQTRWAKNIMGDWYSYGVDFDIDVVAAGIALDSAKAGYDGTCVAGVR